MKRVFNNRNTLYLVFCIVLVCVCTLTIAYATLSVTLNIVGSAEVSAANWDVHLGNAKVDSGSVSSTVPTITSPTTASFSASLVNPGDYYQFTIDVINDGTIDAMIDSIIKTPELTSEQAKYLNYVVEYQNGESINTKQLVSAGSFLRLKVKVEFRKDISVSDLPSSATVLNSSFTINYVQSDENVTNVKDNGKLQLISVISGDYDTVGSEFAIGDEHFYVISSTEDSVTMLSKYNLEVGYYIGNGEALTNPTGIQYKYTEDNFDDYEVDGDYVGVTVFASTNYWSGTSVYPSSVYSSLSSLYEYNLNYKNYLESLGVSVSDVRLATRQEVINLGCNSDAQNCSDAYEWVKYGYSWTSDAYDDEKIICFGLNYFGPIDYYDKYETVGIRPVVVIPKIEF